MKNRSCLFIFIFALMIVCLSCTRILVIPESRNEAEPVPTQSFVTSPAVLTHPSLTFKGALQQMISPAVPYHLKMNIAAKIADQLHCYARFQDKRAFTDVRGVLETHYDQEGYVRLERTLRTRLRDDLRRIFDLARISKRVGIRMGQDSPDGGEVFDEISDFFEDLGDLLGEAWNGWTREFDQKMEDLRDLGDKPADQDTDGDGISDAQDIDNDGDGYSDQAETEAGTDKDNPDEHPDGDPDVEDNNWRERDDFWQGPGCWSWTCISAELDAMYRSGDFLNDLLGQCLGRVYSTDWLIGDLERELEIEKREHIVIYPPPFQSEDK